MSSSSPVQSQDCIFIPIEKGAVVAGYVELMLDKYAEGSDRRPLRFALGNDQETYMLVRRYLIGKRDKNNQFSFCSLSGAERAFRVTDTARECIEISFVQPTYNFGDHSDEHPPI